MHYHLDMRLLQGNHSMFCDIHIFSATTTAEALHFSIQELIIVECSAHVQVKQLNACAFSDGVEKQKCCLGPCDIKNVITLLLYNFLIQNLAGCFVTAIATVSVDFYIFPIVGVGAIYFQSQKTDNPPLFQGVFSHQKKWKII